MKKFRVVIAALVFSLLFATTAFAADKAELSNNAARHLIEKSNEAMDGVTAFKMEGIIEMFMDMAVEGQREVVEAGVAMEALVDIPKVYIKYDMDMGLGHAETMEMFMSDNGVFAKMPMLSEDWEMIADAGSTELMGLAISGDEALVAEMVAEMGLDVAALEDALYSTARYTRNMKIEGKSHYVVDMDFDIKALMGEMMGYMESIYIMQEADMYEGYAEEAMFMMNMMVEKIDGNAKISMYIDKETFNMGYMSMYVELDMDMEALLGVKMDMVIDAFIKYSEFGSKNLPFPVIEVQPVAEAPEVEVEVEEVEEVELEEIEEVELEEVEEVEEFELEEVEETVAR